MNSIKQPKLIKISEAATMLNVSLPTMYNIAKGDNFPLVKVGKQSRIDKEKLETWIANGGAAV